jgi:hypothetical protein
MLKSSIVQSKQAIFCLHQSLCLYQNPDRWSSFHFFQTLVFFEVFFGPDSISPSSFFHVITPERVMIAEVEPAIVHNRMRPGIAYPTREQAKTADDIKTFAPRFQ